MDESKHEETHKRVIKQPKEKGPSFLDRPVTRRDLLKLAAVGGASYLLKDFIESNQDTDEYSTPEKVKEAILFLERLNLEIPQDQLYGFTFPSTKEMAEKYKEALSRTVGEPPVSSLIIVQEKEPRTFTRTAKVFLGIERRSTAPNATVGYSQYAPSILYLPDYTQKDTVAETAITLYHEGFHIFYQNPQDGESSGQRIFDREIMPTIAADVLLEKLLRDKGYKMPDSDSSLASSYFQAVSENKREGWESALKKLNKLPADCCTFPSIK